MNIDRTFKFLNFIVNKNQSGNITPEQFNIDAERSQIEFFNKEFRLFQQTREVSDALAPFLIPTIVNPDLSGQVAYPSDYVHVASLRHLYYVNNVAVAVPIEEVPNNEIGDMAMSQVAPATVKYPKVSYYNTYLQFYPKTIRAVQFDYFKKPTPPVWGYTMVGVGSRARPVYDPTTSVDFEVDDTYQNELVMMMASFYGIYLSSQQITQYAEAMKAQQI